MGLFFRVWRAGIYKDFFLKVIKKNSSLIYNVNVIYLIFYGIQMKEWFPFNHIIVVVVHFYCYYYLSILLLIFL